MHYKPEVHGSPQEYGTCTVNSIGARETDFGSASSELDDIDNGVSMEIYY